MPMQPTFSVWCPRNISYRLFILNILIRTVYGNLVQQDANPCLPHSIVQKIQIIVMHDCMFMPGNELSTIIPSKEITSYPISALIRPSPLKEGESKINIALAFITRTPVYSKPMLFIQGQHVLCMIVAGQT